MRERRSSARLRASEHVSPRLPGPSNPRLDVNGPLLPSPRLSPALRSRLGEVRGRGPRGARLIRDPDKAKDGWIATDDGCASGGLGSPTWFPCNHYRPKRFDRIEVPHSPHRHGARGRPRPWTSLHRRPWRPTAMASASRLTAPLRGVGAEPACPSTQLPVRPARGSRDRWTGIRCTSLLA